MDGLRRWDIGKLEVKPGDLLVFRLNREMYPAVGGDRPMPADAVERVFEGAKKVVREALDTIGLTEDKVPLLFLTEDWDIHAISPLDLINKSVMAAKAKETFDE